MIRGFSRRGQPLAVLALVLGGWVSARAMMWDAQAMPMVAQNPPVAAASGTAPSLPAARPAAAVRIDVFKQAKGAAVAMATSALHDTREGLSAAAGKIAGKIEGVREIGLNRKYQTQSRLPAATPVFATNAGAVSHGTVSMPARRMTGMAAPPAATPIVYHPQPVGADWFRPAFDQGDARLPQAGFSAPAPGIFTPAPDAARSERPARPRAKRWSMDGWYYWRRGTGPGLSQGAFAPSYGASQSGGVLRYRLVPSSGHKPSAYLRTTAALNGSGEREAALGLSIRPISHLPVVLAGEGRYTTTPNGREFRPAGFAYTELPPIRLPLGLRGEAYAQGGYVGGGNATPFVDGQLRIDHKLLKLDKPEVRLGGGVWGGAQKGAARLDAGPSIVVSAPLRGSLSARLAADWRFRLTGDAAPDSGPSVTVSAGF
ncbi:MAG: hypothetical protein AB7F98_11925 [Novosphingobium sp.]